MVFSSPSPVCFYITDNFPVYWYGIVVSTACLAGIIASYFCYKKFNSDSNPDRILDMATLFLLFGILGARLYYCILNPVYFFNNPIEILNIRGGGLSIHGGLIAGILTLIFFAYKYKMNKLKLLDAFSCGTALAQSIGRWGNFFNSEAFGIPTNLPWKLYIPPTNRPDIYADYEYFHPTFLYESILDFCLFIILYFILRKFTQNSAGITFFSYLTGYAIIRLLVESLRIDSAMNIMNIPIATIISTIMLIIGISGIIFISRKQTKTL